MIPNIWYPVLDSRELLKGKPIGVIRFGQKLVFWRGPEDSIICMVDKCRHRGAALSAGKVLHGHFAVPFPWLRIRFQRKCCAYPCQWPGCTASREFSGFQPIPPRRRMISSGFGGVNPNPITRLSHGSRILTAVFSYGRDDDLWPVHYSRAIEKPVGCFSTCLLSTITRSAVAAAISPMAP